MVRQPKSERQRRYEQLKSFILAFAEFIDSWSLTQPPGRVGSPGPDGEIVWRTVEGPPLQMTPSLRSRIAQLETHSFSEALRGIRMALNDSLEMTRDLPTEGIKQADEFLTRHGCPSLTAMRELVWQRVPKILKRGRIRNDEEYYLIIERLNDISESRASRVPTERRRAA